MSHFTGTDQHTTLNGLRHELHALAMLADLHTLYGKAGEIALDFDHWCLSVLSQFQGELTVRQRAS